MSQYQDFAEVYAEKEYTDHSAKMVEVFSQLLNQYDIECDKLLDLACGEGTFLRNLDQGFQKKGLDLSEELIEIARNKSDSSIRFEAGDMRNFSESGFGVVTCWYDSLNYLRDKEELESAFSNVHDALDSGGYFIFDMNTSYWLSDGWPSQGTYVARDEEEIFELHRTGYDGELRIFELTITGFKKKDGGWNKFEEVHREKAYKLSEIKSALREQSFKILDIFGDIGERKELEEDDPRMWVIAKKKEEG